MSVLKDNDAASTSEGRFIICDVHKDALIDFIKTFAKQKDSAKISIWKGAGELFSVRYTFEE